MSGETAGRSSRRYRGLVANLRAQRRPLCCICHQRIDYRLNYPHPASFSAEHVKSWADHPELREDPGNLDASHLACNRSSGNRTLRPDELTLEPDLGQRSRAW